MAKKKTTKKKTTKKKTTKKSSTRKAGTKAVDATGKQLVIVESPAKARTINKYLGPDYVVLASVGHVRDLPAKPPKGVKREQMPVPGVDLEHDFKPTYEAISGKKTTISELKKAAKQADHVWLATDLDREGEAIAWHLAEALSVPIADARRVVFNAITKDEIQRAFEQAPPVGHGQGQCPTGAADPRPDRRLSGVASFMEEGGGRPECWACAIGRGAFGGRTRTRDRCVCPRGILEAGRLLHAGHGQSDVAERAMARLAGRCA